MTEPELRALVRDVIAQAWRQQARRIRPDPSLGSIAAHASACSHAMFVLPVGADGDGPA